MISVIITITDGDWHLERCIEAIFSQPSSKALQVIVPYVLGRDPVEGIRQRFPAVQFVEVPAPAESGVSVGLDHCTYDLRRAAGLRAAEGDIVAMTEDHAIPAPDWLSRIALLHRELPYAAIGGAIDNAAAGLLNQAVYLADFGRYQSPVQEGPAAYVSDINVSYKRGPLELVRESWVEFYHETAVHSRLAAAGHVLWLSPQLQIGYDRGSLSWSRLVRERIAWARLFAARRIEAAGLLARLGFLVLTPALPALLYYRRLREAAQKGRVDARFWLVSPIFLFLLILSAFGEFLGYATGRDITGPAPAMRRSFKTST